MKDLLSGVWDDLGGFVAAWLIPSLLAVGYVAAVVLPIAGDEQPWAAILGLGGTDRALAFAFAVLTLAFLLASSSTPLTRVLEGYYLWPPKLKRWRVARHRDKRATLLAEVNQVPDERRIAVRERLNAYPRKRALVQPTKLGNALQAGESYGWVQYGFSVPDLWTHLTAVCQEGVNAQLRRSRNVLDFFVAAVWVSLALAVLSFVVAAQMRSGALVVWGVGLLALVPFWYLRAVGSVGWYARSMWALADLAREPLAKALGIRLPGDLEQERTIWKAVSEYSAWGPGWERTATWVATVDEALTARGATAPAGADRGAEEAGATS